MQIVNTQNVHCTMYIFTYIFEFKNIKTDGYRCVKITNLFRGGRRELFLNIPQ